VVGGGGGGGGGGQVNLRLYMQGVSGRIVNILGVGSMDSFIH